MSERRSLFRAEAIANQRLQQSGEVVLLRPIPARLLFWALFAACVLIIAFLAHAQYARKETVVGYLAPTAGVARIAAPRAGTIAAVHVSEGQEVGEGTPLVSVRIDQTAADGQNVDAALLETLARRKAALAEQITMQEARSVPEYQRLHVQIAGIKDQIAHLKEQIALQRERVELTGAMVTSVQSLRAKGYITEVEFRRRQESHLDSRQALGALAQQLASRHAELAQAVASQDQLPTTISEKVQTLRGEVVEAEQRIAEIEGRRAYVVRAPVAGRISTLQAAPGQAADPRRPLLSILPRDAVLEAELFVPAQAIGFVRTGHAVRILYDAFPYQRFGAHGGRVIRVARTMLTGGDLQAPIALNQPAYKVTVALDRQDISVYGEHIPLQPDMLLKADILLDRRPLLAWLLDPLLSARIS